ncbi:GMC oxidoreductase-domain-containing protein [Aspergillus germanicus]
MPSTSLKLLANLYPLNDVLEEYVTPSHKPELLLCVNCVFPFKLTARNAIGGFWNPNSLDPVLRERSCARTTYYELASNRSNYHVLTKSLVTKLTRDLSGVEYIPGYSPDQTIIAPNATTRQVQAHREIIMAVGALHTPKILQLSGIGSSSVLDRLGINQIINLPGVGENFQDHLAQYLAVVVTNISDPT